MLDENTAPDSHPAGEIGKTRFTIVGPGLENDPGISVPASTLIRMREDAWAWHSTVITVQFFALDLEEAQKEGFELLADGAASQCLMLHSQFRIYATYIQEDLKKELYLAYPQDIQEIKKFPVILASSLTRSKEETSFTSKRFLPPAEHGTVGIVVSAEGSHYYTIDMLPKAAQERQKHISAILEELEEFYAEGFTGVFGSLETSMFNEDQEVRDMIQQLAQDYYQYHMQQREHKPRHSLPSMTSMQITRLPSVNGFRAIEQGFGPGLLQPSLWNNETAEEQHLATPNGSLLKIKGQEDYERKALYEYINGMMGTEGLKHMLILLDTYYIQTGGHTRMVDAQVSLRQLLIRMGYSETQADDINERRKLAHAILYLARTWVTSTETRYEEEPRGRGKKRRKGIEYTPLLVIEKMKSSPDGGLDVPDEVKFHLGEDFYNNLFGEHKQFFTLPTAQALSYHAQREQQELCLVFYLSNMINSNHPRAFEVSFYKLLLQSGLQQEKEINQGTHRTRDALSVIYALERLEIDGIICRLPHDDVDLVLAAEYFTDKCFTGKNKNNNRISQSTLERINKSYFYVQGLSSQEIQTKRRIALQRLLSNMVTAKVLSFKPGTLLKGRAEILAEQKAKAIEASKQVEMARAIKATKAQKKSAKKRAEEEE